MKSHFKIILSIALLFFAIGFASSSSLAQEDEEEYIADGEPKNAGVFSIDDRGNNVHVIESINNIGDISAFAVSLEPAGGVPAPTGKIYLLGETQL